MKEIKINSKKYGIKIILIDDADFEFLNDFKWSLKIDKDNRCYAHRKDKGKEIKLHRFILNCPTNYCVDHIDGNGLNNQRDNLRICTYGQNSRNSFKYNFGLTSSKYKGVTWDKQKLKWRAQISFEGKHTTLGRYKIEIEAAKAYDKKAKELFGEFARLNFPEDK